MLQLSKGLSHYLDIFKLLLLSVIISVIPAVSATCPRDVTATAYGCFTSYSRNLQNMESSRRQLCCGVDVETLRAFCSSYVQAMSCIRRLKSDCPESYHSKIDVPLVNLEGAHEGLHDLCSDDFLYERYARYQSCFMLEGDESEYCFHKNLNTSIRILSKIDKTTHQLCTDMKKVVKCITYNINLKCGPRAAELVELLVKPMVRHSAQCNYHIDTETTSNFKRPGVTKAISKHHYISDGSRNSAHVNMTSGFKMALLTILYSYIFLVLFH
ncbi:hypothetical protein SNE40_013813 [Patella caerulea]|uniref:Uncharacterized protein n=1 Tax=Patella caerulea TaxID=87958 RepID=A0AAN8JGY1_PATCE